MHNTVSDRVAILLPSLLRDEKLPFLTSTEYDRHSLNGKIRDIFVSLQFPEAVLKLRQYVEGFKPKWTASFHNTSNDKLDSSSSCAVLRTELKAHTEQSPAQLREHASFISCHGDVDGLVFNSFLMTLIIFEGSNHFGCGRTSSVRDHDDSKGFERKNSSNSSNFYSDDNLSSFVETCHYLSVIAAVLRSFRFRGGIDKISCSATADCIPRLVFVWLSNVPLIPLSFCGTNYDPVKCAAALVACVSKGLISFGSFVIWLLYPALKYISKFDRTTECRRLLSLADVHKQIYSHLENVSTFAMHQAIENAAKNDAAVLIWQELIRIVSNSKVGGCQSEIVAEWDAQVVRDMLHDVAFQSVEILDDSVGQSSEEHVSIKSNRVAIANQIARIMIDLSHHGIKMEMIGSKRCNTDSMARLMSLFYHHVTICTSSDPFHDIDQIDSLPHSSFNANNAAFISIQLQEFRHHVSSHALSDALIFAHDFVDEKHGNFELHNGSCAAPNLQTLMATHYTSAEFITRISKFFIVAVEVGLVLVGSGIIPAAAAAITLRNLCPTLTSRYFNHMLLLISASDISNTAHDAAGKTLPSHDCSINSPIFAPLDHALPLMHLCSCSQSFHSWAHANESHAASALRNKETCLSSRDWQYNAFAFNKREVSNVAHHCSSFSASALLRNLHLELGLSATLRCDKVGEQMYAQRDELISLLEEWICKNASSCGADESTLSCSKSNVSVWRCEVFRALNCSFMELSCSPSLMLASLGIVASRLSVCDSIFQDAFTMSWQQATLHVDPASSRAHLNIEHSSWSLAKIDHQSVVQCPNSAECSLTEDDDDDQMDSYKVPNKYSDRNSTDAVPQHMIVPVNTSCKITFPYFSIDSCWEKMHAAMLLLPTAVRNN
jgi:hypothetical protein